MNTGEYTTTTTITAQGTTPFVSAGVADTTVLYANSDTDYLRWGFAEGSIVSLSGETYGSQTATVSTIATNANDDFVVNFTSMVSAATDDTMTKNFTGPNGTAAAHRRKRLLGY